LVCLKLEFNIGNLKHSNLKNLLLAIFTATIGTLPVFLTGALGPEIEKHLGLTSANLGELVATYFLFAGLSSFTLKSLADNRSPLIVMLYGLSVSSVGTLLIAIFAYNFMLFLIWLSICGIAAGIIQPATNAFLSDEIVKTRQGLAFGVKQSATPASTLLGGLALPLIALTVGWQYSYLIAFFMGLICISFIVANIHKNSRISYPVNSSIKADKDSKSELRHHRGALIMLTFGFALGSATANTYGAFFVSETVKAGFNPKVIGYVFAASSVTNLIIRVVFGNFADKKQNNKFPNVLNWVIIMLAVGSVGYLFFLTHNIVTISVGSFLAALLGWGWPGLTNLAVVRRFPEVAHRATGVTQTGVYFGAVLGPIIFGFLDANFSADLAWSVNFIMAIAAAVTIFVGKTYLYLNKAFSTNEVVK
jgi:MFS family permease